MTCFAIGGLFSKPLFNTKTGFWSGLGTQKVLNELFCSTGRPRWVTSVEYSICLFSGLSWFTDGVILIAFGLSYVALEPVAMHAGGGFVFNLH